MLEIVRKTALENRQRAMRIIEATRIKEIWEQAGATINLVGSLRMGLLVKHRDIDFHIYSSPLSVEESFAAVSQLAQHPAIKRVEYANLLDTEEQCIEWHAWYCEKDEEPWQIDMIHILKGSKFDGYFERMADRITEVLTPEQRDTILTLKYDTPDDLKIMGIEYYRAVIEGGVKNFGQFDKWRKQHPVNGITEWIP